MLTSTCFTCHKPKTDLRAIHCEDCRTVQREAEQHFAAEHEGASESDILYAGRQALMSRAHHANRNFVDPRTFAATRHDIPTDKKDGK